MVDSQWLYHFFVLLSQDTATVWWRKKKRRERRSNKELSWILQSINGFSLSLSFGGKKLKICFVLFFFFKTSKNKVAKQKRKTKKKTKKWREKGEQKRKKERKKMASSRSYIRFPAARGQSVLVSLSFFLSSSGKKKYLLRTWHVTSPLYYLLDPFLTFALWIFFFFFLLI